MRCRSCLQISIADIRDCEVLQKPSFAVLKSSADSGCDLCRLSYTAISLSCSGVTTKVDGNNVEVLDLLCCGQNPTRADRSDTRVYLEGQINDYYECNQLKEKVEKVSVRVGGYSAGENSIEAFLKIGVDSDSVLTKYIAGRLPSQYPNDQITMSRVNSWLQGCDQRHKSCAFLSADHPLPKRILDISKDKPVVIHTDSTEGRYAALSYCWGTSGRNVMLTSETFKEFTSSGFKMDILPRTIQDAILVCKALGICHLWIDALCIIQKEPHYKDFIAEAPRMSEYYRNAYFTLIAGSAHDCTDGFLNKRNVPKSNPCEVKYDRTIYPSDPNMTGIVSLFLPPSQENGPIQARAWTFQELKLSQRSLIYGPQQVQFICPTSSILEDGEFQKIYSPEERLSLNPRGYPSIHHLIKYDRKPEIRDRAYQIWFGILYGYTSREMTNGQDKLAAIAGFANLLQSIVCCRYIYGLWEEALPQGLLWKTQKPWTLRNKASPVVRIPDRAPSWSWASIDGPILHHFSSHAPRAQFQDPNFFRLKILSYGNVPQSLDPIRAIINLPQAFELVVSGLLSVVWYAPDSSGDPSKFMLSVSQTALIAQRSTSTQILQPKHDVTQIHAAIGTWDTYDDFESKIYCEQQMYALLLTQNLGLLLIHTGGKHYRRIGHFSKPNEELLNNMSLHTIALI